MQDGQANRKNRHDKYNRNHRIKSLCGGCYEQQNEDHVQAYLLEVWQSAQLDEVSRAGRRVSLVQKARARMDETTDKKGRGEMMTLDTRQDLQVTSLHVALSEFQATAQDLYERGFNVFPLPTARDWILRADEKGNVTKHPYRVRMQKVYASRLYFDNSFIELFERSNIGVMCGRTSGNLVAIDCDSQKSFEYVGRELTARLIPFWCITSHRGGAYLLRLAEGEAVNVTKKTSRHDDVEIWGNSHYVVMPPSVHPSGDVYQWKSPEPRFCLPRYESIPVISVNVLEWLGVSLKKSATHTPKPEYSVPSWAGNISQANIETWMNGAAEGSRNARLTSLAYDLAGNNIAQSTAKNILLESGAKCTPPYSERETKAILKSAYKSARTPARSYFGENVTRAKTWQAAAEFAKSFDWNSRQWIYNQKRRGKVVTSNLRAHSVKRVFLALIERAKLDGRHTFRATVRELSIIADLRVMTVSYACNALASTGLVRRATSDDGCNLFSFVDYSKNDTLTINCRNSVSFLEYSKLPRTHAEKDVFGAGHLYTVWRYLLVSPERNPYQVAKALKLSPSVAYSAVKRLQDMGLVTYSQAEGIYYGEARTDAALQLLADEIGKGGRSAAREAKYQQERARYLNAEFMRAKVRYSLETQRLKDGTR